jgi:arginine/lysine/ornithine decarboxylase
VGANDGPGTPHSLFPLCGGGQASAMDQSRAPVLEALADYHRMCQTPFTPPGHKQARGADPRVPAVRGDAVIHSDVLAVAGLDDRTSNGRVLERAEELMADAVHAERAFFSTCGSARSVKSMSVPDARDASLETVRVVVES